jgi:hypothetical protein
MAWEKGYYYRARKVSGRVVREYVGRGRVAELAAQMDLLDRQQRTAAAAALREEKARLDSLDARVAALIKVTDLVAEAALLAAGCHQHKRQWRRKRHDKVDDPSGPDRDQQREGTGEDAGARSERG